MGISIRCEDKIIFIVYYPKQILHYLRRVVIFYPILYQSIDKGFAGVFVGIIKETPFKNTLYAVLSLKIAKLLLKHVIIGKQVISFGDGEAVAGSYKQCVGPDQSTTSFFYIIHSFYANIQANPLLEYSGI